MAYWLMKSEPDVFSWDDMVRAKKTGWDGVRNYQARNHLRAAAPGDLVLIAGKGHEEYQDVGGNRMVFSDVRQGRLCLNRRFGQAS